MHVTKDLSVIYRSWYPECRTHISVISTWNVLSNRQWIRSWNKYVFTTFKKWNHALYIYFFLSTVEQNRRVDDKRNFRSQRKAAERKLHAGILNRKEIIDEIKTETQEIIIMEESKRITPELWGYNKGWMWTVTTCLKGGGEFQVNSSTRNFTGLQSKSWSNLRLLAEEITKSKHKEKKD